MLLTITMNPSIDYQYTIDHFSTGKMNRFANPIRSIGGKGINAGRAAALSGSEVILTGFLAGDQGKLVEKYLEAEHLFQLNMHWIAGETRNAITIMHDNDTHTEIVEAGPPITDQTFKILLEDVKKLVERYPITLICVSGSANTTNEAFYQELLAYIRNHISLSIPIFMDISGNQLNYLLQTGPYKPSFIKPNIHELREILNEAIPDKKAAIAALNHPKFQGIDYLMISCGKEGALFKTHNTCYDIQIPSIPITNTTGSGDASVGGFAHAISQDYPITKALKYSMACGMSNAQHGEVGKINQKDVVAFMQQIIVNQI